MNDMNIYLYVYDLSAGLASQLSMQFVGRQFDGIYHTGVVLERAPSEHIEYFYGGAGISRARAGSTPYGTPVERIHLGTSNKRQSDFEKWIQTNQSRFTMSQYHVLRHNCNTFTHDAASFLLVDVSRYPTKVRDLPDQFLNTPMGRMMEPMINSMFEGYNQQQRTAPGLHNYAMQAASPQTRARAPTSSPSLATGPRPEAIIFEAHSMEKAALQLAGVGPAGTALAQYITGTLIPTLATKGDLPDVAATIQLIDAAHAALPPAKAFILIDVARLIVLTPSGNAALGTLPQTIHISTVLDQLKSSTPGYTMMGLKYAANVFAHSPGQTGAAHPAINKRLVATTLTVIDRLTHGEFSGMSDRISNVLCGLVVNLLRFTPSADVIPCVSALFSTPGEFSGPGVATVLLPGAARALDTIRGGDRRALGQAYEVLLARLSGDDRQRAINVQSAFQTTRGDVQAVSTIAELDAIIKDNDVVVIDFYAEWCGPCKAAAPRVRQLAQAHPEIAVVKVDVDRARALAERYKVASMPTFVRLEGGREARRMTGAGPGLEHDMFG